MIATTYLILFCKYNELFFLCMSSSYFNSTNGFELYSPDCIFLEHWYDWSVYMTYDCNHIYIYIYIIYKHMYIQYILSLVSPRFFFSISVLVPCLLSLACSWGHLISGNIVDLIAQILSEENWTELMTSLNLWTDFNWKTDPFLLSYKNIIKCFKIMWIFP